MVNPSDLRARRVRLAAELSRLDELLSALDAYASEFAPELISDAAKAEDRGSHARQFVVRPRPVKRPATGRVSPMIEATVAVVTEVLNEQNQPVMLSKLHDAVVAAGVSVPSDGDPRNVIGTRLHRSGVFQTISGRGWWFKDRPVPGNNEFAPSGAKENGAPVGGAEDAPEAEEAPTSSIENRPGFRLVG